MSLKFGLVLLLFCKCTFGAETKVLKPADFEPCEYVLIESLLEMTKGCALSLPKNLSLENYIRRMRHYLELEPSITIFTAIYLDRYLKITRSIINEKNFLGIYVCSLGLAQKMLFDNPWDNKSVALAAGVSLSQYNELEPKFLEAFDWNIHVDQKTFDEYAWYFLLKIKENYDSAVHLKYWKELLPKPEQPQS